MTRKRIAVTILLSAFLAVSLYTLNFARTRHRSFVAPQTNQTVPYTQEVASCVKGIKVVKAEVIDAGTPSAAVEVQIENLSNLGIIAVSLEATRDCESYAVTHRTSFKETKPIVVIKPHETDTLNMSLVLGDVPLLVGSVMYEDGTEEGCASSLETLHELKEAEKAKRDP